MTRLSFGGGIIPKTTFYNLPEEKQSKIIDCAVEEFSQRDFDNAKISNIVKNADIARGSIYQYFEDKMDLYLYVIEIIKKSKLSYLENLMSNPMDMPFLDLFKEMYIAGLKFAIDNPRYIRIFSYLMNSRNELYNNIFKKNLAIAYNLYIAMIDKDKRKGLIRADVDSEVFAKIVVDLTVNVSVEELNIGNENLHYDNMLERITQIIKIIEQGVITR